ncbi:Rrf2 family transcriptional regulator [Limosilactobacillus caecicola]|uniref:Rrf2 family transcriptional regulator n=1 Tax=Limosilactobacillus caecicola TaxID=2941332 RepID=UPI00203D395C|nr:Rrf2 family transcriptional regulator [Limosilactobacillus caecicola]
MKFSYKLSDAIHLLSYLYIYKDGDLSSRAIANSIESNPSVVRQLMSDLRNAGLIKTHKGAAKPELAKDLADISMLEVFNAINMDHVLIHVDPKTNPECIVGGNIQQTLEKYYAQIQTQAFEKMRTITLADVVNDILTNQSVR